MPSTFTTNLGIQKPANGEQSGTWGETVNVNSDILDRAISGALSLSLSGTSSTLTTLQGIASDGQYKVLVLTGSPSGTHTITIDAATVQTLYLVVNSTAQSVIFTQGSGGNVTIVAGASAIISSDGAGATAKVTNITDALAMSAVKITGGTITGVTITGITDLTVPDGGTGTSTLTGYVKGAGTAALTASATIPNTDITGLGTMATQAASAVAITGGTITGITPIVVSAGGTGVATLTGYVKGAGTAAFTASATIPSTDITGVTSSIQTQLDAKASLLSPALTGTPTAPTAAVGTNTTQVATTAFVAESSGFDYQVFTASGTWTKPASAPSNAMVTVQMWAGGGSGGRGSESGGGGGGAYLEFTVPVSTLGATEAVTVGAGGANRTTSGSGTAGGNSVFAGKTIFGGGGGYAGTFGGGGGGGGLLGAGGFETAGLFGGGIGANSGGTALDAELPNQAGGGGAGGADNKLASKGIYGGGGGGGNSSNGASSVFGGNGGNGSSGGGTSGTAPAGGGGGCNSGTTGAGGNGEVRIYTQW